VSKKLDKHIIVARLLSSVKDMITILMAGVLLRGAFVSVALGVFGQLLVIFIFSGFSNMNRDIQSFVAAKHCIKFVIFAIIVMLAHSHQL